MPSLNDIQFQTEYKLSETYIIPAFIVFIILNTFTVIRGTIMLALASLKKNYGSKI